jgi:nucleotide-binding universal stress UspA family protein
MFKRILVPLDGSSRAESAIPVAARIARAYGASITLLRIAETPVEYGQYLAPPSSYAKEVIDADIARLKEYLEKVVQAEDLAGIKVEMKALFGAVAPTILAVAQAYHVSLIVMCSHGYTGFKRWILGSVADKITRHAPVPVLILREGASLPALESHQPVRALAALDGSPLSEAVFEPVAYLVAGLAHASSQQGELRLLRVIDLPFTSGKLKSQTYIDSETRDEAVKVAQDYLGTLTARLEESNLADLNISVTTSVESDPDVAEAIIKQAQSVEGGPVDLIAMATHGRGGIQHFVMGSITERVLHHGNLPLLIVRPPKEQSGKQEEQGTVVEVTEVDVHSWVGLL